MEDKFGGKIMTKFAELRAKLFLYEQLDMEKPEHRHCKGMRKNTDVVEKTLWNDVVKCVVKKTLTFNDYKKCLCDGENDCRETYLGIKTMRYTQAKWIRSYWTEMMRTEKISPLLPAAWSVYCQDPRLRVWYKSINHLTFESYTKNKVGKG